MKELEAINRLELQKHCYDDSRHMVKFYVRIRKSNTRYGVRETRYLYVRYREGNTVRNIYVAKLAD